MRKNLFWYRLYGCTFCSEIEFPMLITTTQRDADFSLRIADLKRKIEDPTGCFVDVVTKECIYYCNQVGCFQMTRGKLIEITPNPGVALETLSPFIFGYCIAMLFWQRGLQAFHCSASEYEDQTLIVCGNSGAGKSTFTKTLLKHGFHLMTDDVAMLDLRTSECPIVYPAFPQQKLCRDAAERNNLEIQKLLYIDEDKDKYAVACSDSFCLVEKPLKAIICLEIQNYDKEVHLTELQGHNKLIFILKNLFLFPMFRSSNVFAPEDMKQCMALVQKVPVYRMARPVGFDSTEEQFRCIMKEVFQKEADN